MSTSDPHEHGPLTRKQLREIRLTGATPVITPEEAAAAAAAASEPAATQDHPADEASAARDASEPDAGDRAEEHSDSTDGDRPVAPWAGGLTRRQVRERERARTGSVPAVSDDELLVAETEDATGEHEAQPLADAPSPEAAQAEEPIELEVIAREPEPDAASIVAGVPEFAHDAPGAGELDDDDDEGVDDVETVTPVSAAAARPEHDAAQVDEKDPSSEATSDDDVTTDERPVVNPAFGVGVLSEPVEPPKPFTPSFDELLTVGDSTGSQHLAPSALIFTPSPGEGSLSGPVASTGEILVTGSYELPRGMGSQGHAHGTTDGKDIDAVLIDGELAPSSSPTPIAASSAVSTIKPAGEVIRPPAPEKGNKLMLILAITAGGLALALGVVLVVAITTNVF